MDSLVGKRSPKAIRSALEMLPKGSEAYDQAYTEAMARIGSQIADSQELAKQALSWITCAKRPLTSTELRHALAVEINEPEFDDQNLTEIADILNVCAGLVTIDEESGTVRLIHYTTQEYFERTWDSWFPNVQMEISETCLTYLSFGAFGSGACLTDAEFEARLQSNPLYYYAAKHWGYHAYAASIEARQSVLRFLRKQAILSGTYQAAIASKYLYGGYSQWYPKHMTGVHLAARFGFTDVLAILGETGHQADYKNSWGRTPLSLAAENGHEAVVKLLVDRPDVDADSKDNHGWTPLSWAAWNGHEGIVKLLVDRPDVDADSKDNDGRTPLSWAACNGQEKVVKLLVDRPDVDANSRDKDGETPLFLAAWNGHEGIVKLLVDRPDVDADSKNKDGQTPLSKAAWNGHEGIVKLLVHSSVVDA
jgi:hypothetical protein